MNFLGRGFWISNQQETGCHSQSSHGMLPWCQCSHGASNAKEQGLQWSHELHDPRFFWRKFPWVVFLPKCMKILSPPPFLVMTNIIVKKTRGAKWKLPLLGGRFLRPLEVGTFRGFFLDFRKHRVNVLFNSYKQNWEMYLLVKHTKQKAFGFLA